MRNFNSPARAHALTAREERTMHSSFRERVQRASTRSVRAVVTICFAAVVSAGCDNLLEVEVPGSVEASTLDTPEMMAVLVPGVVADFECAFANYILLAGTVGDEIMNAGVAAAYNNYDRRRVDPGETSFATGSCASGTGLYSPVSTARYVADDVYRRLEKFTDAQVPGRVSFLATTAAYAGYSLILLGEGFCEAAIDAGPLLSRTDVLRLAELRFTNAIQHAQAANHTEILRMAYVGRARARLGLGDLANAAADAKQVPQGFRKDATFGSVNPRRENKIFTFTHRDRPASIAPEFWNLTWSGVADPRVRVTNTTRLGLDGLTPLYVPDAYASAGAPIPIATWEEAQLIIAEAEGGQSAINIINGLLQRAGLPANFTAANAAEIRNGIIEQRRRQLFLQSHRLGDMLRYNLPFPTGLHPWKRIDYGTQTCFPLPDVERLNNPNLR
jgi:hypothetical protein